MDRKIIEKEIEEYNRGGNKEGCCCDLFSRLEEIKKDTDGCRLINHETLMLLVKGSHQYCISDEAIEEAISILSDNREWTKDFDCFEDLYDVIIKLLIPIHNIAALTVYDTSLRIGYSKGILPKDYVYLASGAKEGAECIYGAKTIHDEMKKELDLYINNNLKGLNDDLKDQIIIELNKNDGNRIKVAFFKEYFGGMDSMNIEHILCTNFCKYSPKNKTNKSKSK